MLGSRQPTQEELDEPPSVPPAADQLRRRLLKTANIDLTSIDTDELSPRWGGNGKKGSHTDLLLGCGDYHTDWMSLLNTILSFYTRKFPWFWNLKYSCLYPCLKSCEDGAPQIGDHEQEEDDEEDTEGEKREQEQVEAEEEEEQREEDHEAEREELNEETQQREEDECADYPECTSLCFRESDGEKSLDLTESPRPLSQETRNLTASELLLNKSVDTR